MSRPIVATITACASVDGFKVIPESERIRITGHIGSVTIKGIPMKLKAKHYRSKALRSMHEVAVDLYSVGTLPNHQMRERDINCLTPEGLAIVVMRDHELAKSARKQGRDEPDYSLAWANDRKWSV